MSGISKRGNRYIRKILIHGARAAVIRLKRERAPMGAWMTALETRAASRRIDSCDGQQDGSDRMGRVVEWQRRSSASALHCLVSTRGIDIGRVRGCFVFDHKKSRIYFRHKAVGFTCLF
jgi:Transposase IS116/IS110/IS902 family